jgi:hypothetical protein
LLDLVGFLNADFAGCEIDRKSTYDTCHFLDLLLFTGLLKNNVQLPNPPHRVSMQLLLPNPLDCAHHERLWSEV